MEYKWIICLSTVILLLFPLTAGKVTVTIDPKQDCTCVPYYQCEDDSGAILTDGQGLLDARVLKGNPCKGDFDVCCNVTTEALYPTTEAPEKHVGCGYRTFGYFPWYATLSFQEANGLFSVYKCGVSLIHAKAVLTAAHCVKRKGIWSVRIGNSIREVSNIIKHPKYSQVTMHNDLALAILKEPVEISEKINTICIAPKGAALDDARCKVTSRLNNNKEGAYLKMLQVPILSRETCLKKLRTTRLGPYFQLHNSFLCAGGNKQRNTCVGDGGSPLVCPIPGQPNRYHQTGIVSWGIGCENNDVPDVYVKLSMFRDWIDSEMLKQGLDITSYRY